MTSIKMICHKFNFPNGMEIYGFSDLHIGSKEFNEDAFSKASRDILSQDNRFVVLIGDYVDNGIKSSVTSPYDAIMQPKAQRDYAAELLFPLKDRILCGVGGNHEARTSKESDFDPAECIMSKIGLEDRYRREAAYMLVNVAQITSHHITPPLYTFFINHGSSGGQLLGSGLSKNDQYAAISGADINMSGHTHKPGVAPGSRWECDKAHGLMIQRNYGVVICTAWLDYGGYGASRPFRPVPIALNHVILDGKEKHFSVKQVIE